MPIRNQSLTRTTDARRGRRIQLGCLLGFLFIPATSPTYAADNSVTSAGNLASDGQEVASRLSPFSGKRFTLERGDVVAFVGGTDVATAQHSGHLESLLAVKYPGVHFRNFGWEGDTVFAQPRDVGFPSLQVHLQRAQASVIVFQFGRTEALSGRDSLPDFIAAYRKLLEECARQTPRLVLVTPPLFEKGGDLLPDLSLRNRDLAIYAKAIRELARQRKLPLVDLFGELGGRSHREPRLTGDGLQLTQRGHAQVARAFARQLGLGKLADHAGDADEQGVWRNTAFERVRKEVVAKNRLWFDYWRPQNWAFLGGDRTSQPSSRDYRNPNVRWFPAEMERFVPLIQQAETRIEEAIDNIPLK